MLAAEVCRRKIRLHEQVPAIAVAARGVDIALYLETLSIDDRTGLLSHEILTTTVEVDA